MSMPADSGDFGDNAMSAKRNAVFACLLLAGVFALGGCGKSAPPSGTATNDAPTNKYAFTVVVTLSDAARKKLSQSGESVIVGAEYFGEPAADAGKDMINDIGAIDLGRREVEIPGAGKARFDGSALKRDRLAFVKGKPQVNVNVWSGRKSSPDNLLNCDMFQNAIEVAAQKPIKLHCRLIAEPDENTRQP